MWLVVPLVLCADPIWTETLGAARSRVVAIGRPTRSQVLTAFDDFDRAVKVWERERREQAAELAIEQQRIAAQREREADAAAAAAVPDTPPSKKGKVIEVGRGIGKSKSRGKVIELPQRDKVDAQMEELAEEVRVRRALCAKDPVRCEREKKQRQAMEKGNDAWDEAVTANYEKRRAAIEAEARRFQEELNSARRREEQKQAEKLGGAIDNEGNFVDSDLKDVPER